MSMKKFQYCIGNRTRNISVFSAVPQPTAPPLAPIKKNIYLKNYYNSVKVNLIFLCIRYEGIISGEEV
jgi:hypothetical protein